MPERAKKGNFASRDPVTVEIFLPFGVRVEGAVYLSMEPSRFSDAWEEIMRDPRAFVPLPKATTRAPDGSIGETDGFLLVRKSDIIAVRPVDAR